MDGTKKPNDHVLIVLHSDGHIQVFGEKHINAICVNRPIASTPQEGIEIDELLDAILPYQHKQIFYPGKIRTTGNVRPITIERLAQVRENVRALGEIGTKSKFANVKGIMLATLGGAR